MSAGVPGPPPDSELMTELRQLAILIQRQPDQKRKIITDWYERALEAVGTQKAEMGLLLLTILNARGADANSATIPEIHAVKERPIVISLHGIRTRGDWQKELSSALSRNGFVYEPLDYGFFRAIQLVLPWARDAKKKWFLEKYTAVTKGYLSPPSIIAHSLGTYLVARTMQKYTELRFDRIIFCGSIAEVAYPWTAIINGNRAIRVLNDYGGKDFWAKVAVWVVNDAGPSGAKGFRDNAGGRVLNRCRPEFRHSDFFYEKNYENTWIPFLLGRDPALQPETARRPPNWRFRIFVCSLLLLGLIAGYFLYHVAQQGVHRASPLSPKVAESTSGGQVVEDQRRGGRNPFRSPATQNTTTDKRDFLQELNLARQYRSKGEHRHAAKEYQRAYNELPESLRTKVNPSTVAGARKAMQDGEYTLASDLFEQLFRLIETPSP